LKYRIKPFLAAFLFYVLGVFIIAAVNYSQERERLLADIDTRLLAAASNIPNILPRDFHDIARTPDAISKEQDLHNLELMNRHTQSGALTYLYSYVMVDGMIHFTSCNYTQEDVENNQVVTYWTDYPEGAKEYFDAMTAEEPIFVTAGDRWGLFRTILMPMKSPSGLPYVAAADMDITLIENTLTHAIWSVVGMSVLLLIIVVPLLLAYRYTHSIMNSELKTLNTKLQIDIDQALILEAELKQATHDANMANDIKGQFLSNMSHELRTPINGILGMNELLLDMDLTDEQVEYISICNSSALVLLDTVTQILDVAAIESGGLTLKQKSVNSRAFFDEIISMFSAQAGAKKLDIVLTLGQDFPAEIIIDPVHLRKVLINLIGNAIKFTSTGGIKVLISWRAGYLHGMVQDSGIGIPEDSQQRIFETFQQVDNSYTREYAGTGLGLPISQQICDIMGGELSLYQSNKQGSVFKFHIEAAAKGKELVPELKLPAKGSVCVFTDSEILRNWFFSELNQPSFKGVEGVKDASLNLSSFSYLIIDSNGTEEDLLILADKLDLKRQQLLFLSWVGQGLSSELKNQVKLLRKPVLISELVNAFNNGNDNNT
jgi:signal transduction histidine kinase